MAKTSKNAASQVERAEGFEGRYEDLGGYTVGFESYSQDVDLAPLFRGLPDDRCQARHWGVVLKGKVGFRYADHEEIIEAGEAYYAAPGHTPLLFAGTEVVEFTPTDELAATMSVVSKNMGG